jgi:hypothetical protein
MRKPKASPRWPYSLIRDMQGSDFLTALHLLAEQEAMVKNLSDFKEKHKAKM